MHQTSIATRVAGTDAAGYPYVRKPPAADVRTDPSPAIPHHHQNRAEKHRDDNERQHASRDAVAKINDGGAITLVFTIGALCLLGTIMLCL